MTNLPDKETDKCNPAEAFDFADWEKKILGDPKSRAIIEDFLKYRHREWELQMEADLESRAKERDRRDKGNGPS